MRAAVFLARRALHQQAEVWCAEVSKRVDFQVRMPACTLGLCVTVGSEMT